MYDVHVIFRDGPGELARFGQLLGRNGVGLEGGGVFGTDISWWRTGKKPAVCCSTPGLPCRRCESR